MSGYAAYPPDWIQRCKQKAVSVQLHDDWYLSVRTRFWVGWGRAWTKNMQVTYRLGRKLFFTLKRSVNLALVSAALKERTNILDKTRQAPALPFGMSAQQCHANIRSDIRKCSCGTCNEAFCLVIATSGLSQAVNLKVEDRQTVVQNEQNSGGCKETQGN